MDLISSLASAAGISEDKARALAGGVLGTVQSNVQESAGDGAAAELSSAIPELDGWKAAADAATGASEESGGLGGLLGGLSGGSGGGLMGALAGAVGGEDAKNAVVLAGLMNDLGLDAGKAGAIAPVAYGFLKSRLSPGLLSTVLAAAPFLDGILGGDEGDETANDSGAASPLDALGGLGGAASALGGLFGKS